MSSATIDGEMVLSPRRRPEGSEAKRVPARLCLVTTLAAIGAMLAIIGVVAYDAAKGNPLLSHIQVLLGLGAVFSASTIVAGASAAVALRTKGDVKYT